jgi:hypothetical protein
VRLLVPWATEIPLAIESVEIKLKNYKPDQWRLMHIGAHPVPRSLVRELQKRDMIKQRGSSLLRGRWRAMASTHHKGIVLPMPASCIRLFHESFPNDLYSGAF